MHPHPSIGRRALLTGGVAGLALVAAGCRTGDQATGHDQGKNPLSGVRAGTLALIRDYDAAIAAHPDLADRLHPLRADHLAHLAALAQAAGGSPAAGSGSTSPEIVPPGQSEPAVPVMSGSRSAILAALRTAEKSAQDSAGDACLSAAPRYAALLGSIAACRASHLEALS